MITKKDIAKLEGLLMLVAVSENSSKKKVAENLSLSVDTLNKYVTDLEKDLGTKLTASNGRGTVLTHEAQSVVKMGYDIKKIIRSVEAVASHKNTLSGTVRVGMPLAAAAALEPKDISCFWEKYPDIHLESVSNYEPPNLNVLDVDFGITFEPPTGSDLVIVESRSVDCGFMASPSYLSKYGEPKDMDDLLLNHRICGKLNHYRYLKEWKEIMGKAQHICFSSNSNYSVLKIMRYGGGIGIMPLHFADEGLVRLKNISTTPQLKFYLIAHRVTKDIPKIRVVLDYYRKVLMGF